MTHPWDPQQQQCKNYIHVDWMLLMENNSEAFLLADPTSEHCSSPLLFFIGYLHGNKSPVSQLLISSCCLPFLNSRQTFQRGCFQANSLERQKNRAHEHLPEPECQYQARDTPCAQPPTLLVMNAAGYVGRVHWEIFRASSMENESLTLRPCWESPVVWDATSITSQEKPC